MAEYIERESQLRKDCPMRHENGNCLPSGGFCTAVNAPICAAMHNAYYMGKTSAADVVEKRDCEKCKFFSRTSTEYPCSHCRNCYIDQFKPKEGETE